MRSGLSQLDDASYLAARWIVYDAIRQLKHFEEVRKGFLEYCQTNPDIDKLGMADETYKKWAEKRSLDERKWAHRDHYLGFTGIGILHEYSDRTDIEYHYRVVCDGNPTILCGDKKLEDMVEPKKVEGGLLLFQ